MSRFINRSVKWRFRHLAWVTVAGTCLFVIGCAQDHNQPAARETPNVGTQPVRNVTGFTDGLHCLDDLLVDFGVRDVVVVVEDFQDKTGKVTNAAREMATTAVAEMTRRSRAVRIVSGSSDASNLNAILQSTQAASGFKVAPQYAWRGAFTQFDTDITTDKSVLGMVFGPFLKFGVGRDAGRSAMALDASLLRAEDLTVLPQTATRNLIVVSHLSRSVSDGSAQGGNSKTGLLDKLGVTFSLDISTQDPVSQSARVLVELGAIETFGRLATVPYWRCLGSRDDTLEVKRETKDWFVAMDRQGTLSAWVQDQLRIRRRYNGAADGLPSAKFSQAVSRARTDLGLAGGDDLDLPLFEALVEEQLPALPRGTLASGAEALELSIRPSVASGPPGSGLSMEIASSRDAFVYCYRAVDDAIERIFPNRFHLDPHLRADRPVQLPGGDPFAISLPSAGELRFACLGSPVELYNDLPPKLRWGDFHPIGFKRLTELRTAFEATAGGRLAYVESPVTVTPPAAK